VITAITLIGAGGFIVTAISYVLGIVKIFSNLPAIWDALSGFFS